MKETPKSKIWFTGILLCVLVGIFSFFILFMYVFDPNENIADCNEYTDDLGPVASTDSPQSLRDRYVNLQVGDFFEFGTYPQKVDGERKAIRWRILKRDSDSILIISEYGLDCRRYNEKLVETTWANCTLRHWLNNDFVNRAFNSQEQSLIKTSYLTNNAGPSTEDRAFLLSVEEARKLFASEDDEEDGRTYKPRVCKPTEYAIKNNAWVYDGDAGRFVTFKGNTWWWLRSRGGGNYGVSNVNYNGYIREYGCMIISNDGSVRPALRLKLKI